MIISQSVLIIQSGHEFMVEMAIFNVQRAITPKLCNPELRFLCYARSLVLLNICVKFHERSGFEVTELTWVCVKIAIFQCLKGNNSEKNAMQSFFS